jgi:hypothetical protein
MTHFSLRAGRSSGPSALSDRLWPLIASLLQALVISLGEACLLPPKLLDGPFIIDMSVGKWGIVDALIFGSSSLFIFISMAPFHLQASSSARTQ